MLSKVLSLDYLSRPKIWNIEKEKDRESRRQASEAQREIERQRARARDKKQQQKQQQQTKETNFLGRTTWKFFSGGEKIRNVVVKKAKRNKGNKIFWEHIRHKTCNQEVSGCNINGKEMNRNVCCSCSVVVFFCKLDLLMFFFLPFSLLSPFGIKRFSFWVNYSGALAREAIQRSTMGKKIK